jgi:phenylalanyl-tRNA synthetase beta subunit
VTRAQDVQEEILRIYGYDSVLPAPTMTQSMLYKPYQDKNVVRQRYAN